MSTEPTTYPGYRFPAEVIQHAVWLYHLFSLSLRDIELILAEQGVVVSYKKGYCWRSQWAEIGCVMRLLVGRALTHHALRSAVTRQPTEVGHSVSL